MMYPWERETILLYKFWFDKIDEPVMIEARSQVHALQLLGIFISRNYGFQNRLIVHETVTRPIEGFTTKIENGIKYVYVGLQHSVSGWFVDERK